MNCSTELRDDIFGPRDENLDYLRQDVLFREGEPVSMVFVLEEGYVKLVQHGRSGVETILHICGPGEIVGETGFEAPLVRNATAIALTHCVVSAEPVERVHQAITGNPIAMEQLIHATMATLRDAQNRITHLAEKMVAELIADTPARNSISFDGSDAGDFHPPLLRAEVAVLVGAAVETAIRTIAPILGRAFWESEKITVEC